MSSLVNVLKQSDIFYQLTPTQLEMVANLCSEVTFQAGELIFRENSASKELYIIAEGEVEIVLDPSIIQASKKTTSNDSVIATLRKGQSFGEVALVDEGLRSASTRAIQDNTRLLVIKRERLIMLCETYPQLGYRLMYNLASDLATKIRNTDLRVREDLVQAEAENKK
jgi:CRP/FNR family cyclic AMP-dependent transcriptional regulator